MRAIRLILAGAVLTFASVGTTTALAPTPGHAGPNAPFLAVTIDSIAPSTITRTSDPILAVVATVTNVGDRTVDNVKARIERARAVAAPRGLRSTLGLDEQDFDITGKFVAEVDRLTPGQRKQFTLSIQLRSDTGATASEASDIDESDPDPSLRITQPGVYPVLVNINGTPAYGSTARLADARFLLPVLGVPPDPNTADPPSPQAQGVAPVSAAPVATTVLWPLADRPRRVAGQPGSLSDKVKLTDDELAAELARGGRLDALVGALEFATSPDSDHDHKLADSVCLAIDPDLLTTVAAMTRGYLVPVTPGDVTGPTKDGAGAGAAAAWLARVRELASNLCTVALPFAQADLPAVAAINNADLSTNAITSPSDIVDVLLSTKSVREVSWPSSGSIDDRTGALLQSLDVSTVLVGADAVHSSGPGRVKLDSATIVADPLPAPDLVTVAGGLHAATYDTSLAAALAAVGDGPETPSVTPPRLRLDIGGDSRQARLQDALGALSWTALNPQPGAARAQLVVPPQLWEPNNTEADAVLAQLATLLRSGLATPRSLTDLVAQNPAPAPYALAYLPGAAADAPPPALDGPVRNTAGRLDQISAALVDDPQRELTPYQFIAPLRADLLRALSMAGRPTPGRAGLDASAQGAVTRSRSALDGLFGRVTVLSPGGLYTLAAAHSPLLVVARNELPVAIRVLVKTDAPGDMRITDIGSQQLPPDGTRSLQIPTTVNATRDLVVRFALTTPAGTALGDPISVSVRSNAYGKALTIITECAGALLLLLTGRRLWRRFRGRPDPADEGLDTSTRRRLNRYGRAKLDRTLDAEARPGDTHHGKAHHIPESLSPVLETTAAWIPPQSGRN